MKAYFISGLGADKQAFNKIKLPPAFEPVFLDWIPPQKDESLDHYARRFSVSIKNDDAFVLIGLSFGGMLASEIARIRKPLKTIIISSIATCDELPWYFKQAGRFNLHKAVPIGFLKTGTIINNIMGAFTPEDRIIIKNYARDADPDFVRWSLGAIINWNQRQRLPGIIQIHGTKDHLLPIGNTNPDFTIKDGGHLMVMNRSEEVNKILLEVLSFN